jgi:hypothetical protein
LQIRLDNLVDNFRIGTLVSATNATGRLINVGAYSKLILEKPRANLKDGVALLIAHESLTAEQPSLALLSVLPAVDRRQPKA